MLKEKYDILRKKMVDYQTQETLEYKKQIGKYISFIDSDDVIKENLYESLEKYMKQGIDLIKFKMTKVDEEGNKIEKLDGPTFDVCTGEKAFEKLCIMDQYLEVACIYLYRTEFFLQNKFEYQVATYHEDFGLTPYLMIKATTVVSTDIFGYQYLQRQNSITDNKNKKKEAKKAWDVLRSL